MYKGVPPEEYLNCRVVIATYLFDQLPTESFMNALLDSDSELVEELVEFGAYDTMSRECAFEACAQFLLGCSFVSESDSEHSDFMKKLKKAYSFWILKDHGLIPRII
jgi:hypothetical protein